MDKRGQFGALARFVGVWTLLWLLFVFLPVPHSLAQDEQEWQRLLQRTDEQNQQDQQDEPDQQDQQEQIDQQGAANQLSPIGSQQSQAPTTRSQHQQATKKTQTRPNKTRFASVAKKTTSRAYQVVLDSVLTAFAADARQGPMHGLKRYAVRKLSISRQLPRLHARYIQTAFITKLLQATPGRLITCPPCGEHTSVLVEGKLQIAAPASNAALIDQAAEELKIEHFIDAVLVLEQTHLALAVEVVDAKDKSILWSKAYDSELLIQRNKNAAEGLADIVVARGKDTYVPRFEVTLALGGGVLPNVSQHHADKAMFVTQFRATESFAAKTGKFGIIASLYKSVRSTMKAYPAEPSAASTERPPAVDTTPTNGAARAAPFQQALALQAGYANLIHGAAQNLDQPRHYLGLGFGALAATGYIAPALKLHLDSRFGRVLMVSGAVNYIMPAKIEVQDQQQTAPGGLSAELLMGCHF